MDQGNKRTPQRFVGREAVVTTQCLNGWLVVFNLSFLFGADVQVSTYFYHFLPCRFLISFYSYLCLIGSSF